MRLIFTPILLLVLVATFAQTPKNNRCDPPEETCMGPGCEKRVPVIFGKPYVVPTLKIKLIDRNTNKPAAGIKVSVGYGFKWFEYPYPEHPRGVWSEASYSTECVANEEGVIEVDEFKVEPHGWYKGVYAREPQFTKVTIGYELPYVGSAGKNCATGTDISRSQLERCRRKNRCEFTIRDGCPAEWR
ncbi:MAG: hypothetical protein KF868_13135 [Acidobacteria bacterium]|nr:hypothetical protein [Acidobacteriota bacterium]MCW5970641.1 hypothetical protein [Blastocatellales bacterium]